MAVTQNTRINTLIMRGLSATEATAQAQREAQREARKPQVSWTTHRGGGYVIHADAKWVNGNSPVGLALAVRKHERGESVATGVAGGAHVVHSAGETCSHCPAGS